MSAAVAHYKLTSDQFFQMVDEGVFPEDAHIELIKGELYEISPQGWLHTLAVGRLNRAASQCLDKCFAVSQSTAKLGFDFAPEPDFVLLPVTVEQSRSMPDASDVLLVVEVSVTSYRYDKETKLPHYASTGIPEVWIVNADQERIEVYREPDTVNSVYRSEQHFAGDDIVSSLKVPEFQIQVPKLLK